MTDISVHRDDEDSSEDPVEGFEGEFMHGWRCTICAVMVIGPRHYLDRHRAWHMAIGG